MKKILNLFMLYSFICFTTTSCKKDRRNNTQTNNQSTNNGTTPVDASATNETRSLFNFLHKDIGKEILLGHEDEFLIGALHPRGTGGSDTYDLIGDFPTLYGFDLANVEQGLPKNNAALYFDSIKNKIQYIYSKGGIVTLSWTVNNPVMISEPVDGNWVSYTIQKLFSNQKYLTRFDGWLNELATFFKSLQPANGIPIPILFRPYHECNGAWFWWGTNEASDQEYIHLYIYTENYLKNKGVHNLLYVYCTDKFDSEEEYLKRYPGDDYADILGFDCYDNTNNYPGYKLNSQLEVMTATISSIASQKNKIAAITETGFKNMPITDWWTKTLYPSLIGTKICYLMVWGNYGNSPDTYWGTFKGQTSADNFVTFSKKNNLHFLSNLSNTSVYHINQ